MTFRNTLITIRNWTALLGALGMVGFLTFVPQSPAVETASFESARHSTQTVWPSQMMAQAATR